MARAPDQRIEQVRELYLQGMKLVEIANQLNVSEGTVRSWKSRYKWDCNVAENKRNVAKRKKEEKQVKKRAIAEEIDQVLENTDLTDKQKLFCLHYVRCFNATKAYQKAYEVDYNTAASIGYRLLENVGVREEIQKLKKNRLNREMLDESDIFQKYMDIAFADVTDFVEFGQEEIPVMAVYGPVQVKDEETGEKRTLTKKVNVVRFKEHTEVDGTLISEVKQGKDGASIKLPDKMKALEWLAEHMDMATAEQKARIDQIRANTERLRRMDDGDDEEETVVIVNDLEEEKEDS